MQLILIELNGLNFEYSRKYFDHLKNDSVFVSFKNGQHNRICFLFTRGEIEKDFEYLKTIKITEIKEKIKNFFIK